MKIILASRPIGYALGGWIEGTIIDSARVGYKRIQISPSTVLSIQPANTGFFYDEKPLTSDAPYEQFQIGNDKVAVKPDADWAVIPFMEIV